MYVVQSSGRIELRKVNILLYLTFTLHSTHPPRVPPHPFPMEGIDKSTKMMIYSPS